MPHASLTIQIDRPIETSASAALKWNAHTRKPPSTTPREVSASATRCRKALRAFEVVLALEQPGGRGVGQHPDTGDEHHRRAADLDRADQTLHAFEGDERRDRDERRGVEERDDDLDSPKREGVLGRGRELARTVRAIAHQQRDDIAQVVRRIGEQPKAVGEDAADHLQAEDEQVDEDARKEPRPERVRRA